MRPARAALLACALGAAGCGDAAPAPPAAADAPPGVVLRVGPVAVREAEVRPLAAAIGELFPEYTRPHRLRLALTNVVLPRAACEARYPAESAAARARAEEAWRLLGAGDSPERDALLARADPREDGWKELGVDLWAHARALAPGAWGEPFARAGAVLLVRLDGLEHPGSGPRRELLRLSVLEFPYLDPATGDREVEQAIDSSHLELVDPAWHEYVPESWQHRMRDER